MTDVSPPARKETESPKGGETQPAKPRKNVGGRPTKLDEETHKEIEKRLKAGMTLARVGSHLNLHKDTLYDWRDKGEELLERHGTMPKVPSRQRKFARFYEMVGAANDFYLGVLELTVAQESRVDAHMAREILANNEEPGTGGRWARKERVDVDATVTTESSSVTHKDIMDAMAEVQAEEAEHGPPPERLAREAAEKANRRWVNGAFCY